MKLHSDYTKLTGDEEDRRLRLQNEALRFFDEDVYRRILGQYPSPCILDVGCGNGDMIFRIADENIAFRVFGIDSMTRQIELASARHTMGKFSVMNIESDFFMEDMYKWITAENVAGFDIINCSMVLMHLSNPERALVKLRSLLSEHGTLIVREVDDGVGVVYPDPEGRFHKLFEIIADDDRLGDRHCGRKVYSYLKKAGFQVIRLEKAGLSNISIPDRKLLYEMFIPAFFDYIKNRSENEPENVPYRKAYEWYENNIEKLRQSFCEDEFFISLGFMSFTAM